MPPTDDHPQRYALVNELHARPFPSMDAPCHAVFLAFKEPVEAASRDRARDMAHLAELVHRHGAPEPQPGATHYSGALGRYSLKWESHTEFVTYSAFTPGLTARPFDPAEALIFPPDWQARAPGKRLCAVLVRVELMPPDPATIAARLEEWFVAESLACARVLEGAAIVAADFRIDPAGHMRFAVFVEPGTSPRRVGRIVQRLCEIEMYRAMSMLGLGRARDLGGRLNKLEGALGDLVAAMDDGATPAEETLHKLLRIAAELETLAARFSFRAGATAAYEAIVNDRIEVLREERFLGRQTFAEFMRRRYDPAMRTVKSAENRLRQMLERAARAAELLRTRVDVERSAQNQKLLESMDKRADLQLRLQATVEGLSVVAISYYAVSLAGYLSYPLAEAMGWSKGALTAAITLPVVALVWLMVRRIRRAMH
ncbi:MAG: DUF3422 family protein [Gemmobacter sp.]|uniref:DUF3422 family protein n=1 Tax=Gemmobacter sp. TaxID=1898957 RepID=UPI00391DBB2E